MILPIEELKKQSWQVSWSGGKDSTATVIKMHEFGVPIKSIDYVEMMYSDEIPATLPVMHDFVESAAEVFRSWGYEVNRVRPRKTLCDIMNAIYKRSKYPHLNGLPYGIGAVARGACGLQKYKVDALKRMRTSDYSMVGYAADEVGRVHRLTEKKQSILCTLGINELETYDICREYDLLSPLYSLQIFRDGCFFCPNADSYERDLVYRHYPELAELIYSDIAKTPTACYLKVKKRNAWARDYEIHGGNVPKGILFNPADFLPDDFFDDDVQLKLPFNVYY